MANLSIEAKASLEPQVDKYQTFHNSLDITPFKTELNLLRQVKNPNSEDISQKELEIITLFQTETQNFPIGNLTILEHLLHEVDITYFKISDSNQNFNSLLVKTHNQNLILLSAPENKNPITNNKGQPITATDLAPITEKQSQTNSLTFNQNGSIVYISKSKTVRSDILNSLARYLYEKGYNKESIKIYYKLIKKNPKNISNYQNLSNLLIISGEHEKSAKISRQGIKIDETSIKLHTNLAYAIIHSQNPTSFELGEARDSYKKVLALANGDENWQIYINQANRDLGPLEEYLKAIDTIIAYRASRLPGSQ